MADEYDPVREALELVILRDVEHGVQIDHVALAWEVPGADVRQVATALHDLIGKGELRFTRGHQRPHTMELALTERGREHLERG